MEVEDGAGFTDCCAHDRVLDLDSYLTLSLLYLSNTTLANMSGLEKALFNLKVLSMNHHSNTTS